MRDHYKAYKKVGKIRGELASMLEIESSLNVYVSPGVLNHIIKRHRKQLSKKIRENLTVNIERIILNPDYAGVSYKRGFPVLKLVKKIDTEIMLILEVDYSENYIYVATMYPVTKGKIKNSIYSGKLKPIN